MSEVNFGQKIEDYKIYHTEEYSFPTTEFNVWSENLLNKNVSFLINYLNNLLKQEYFDLYHPLLSHIKTRARKNTQYGMCNYVFFTDEVEQNKWILVQNGHFIEAIIVGREIYKFTPSSIKLNHTIIESFPRLLETITSNNLSWSDSKLSGLFVGTPTPYHFFYDQFITLPSLDIPLDKTIIPSDFLYFPIESVIDLKKHKQKLLNEGVFLFPYTIRQDFLINPFAKTIKNLDQFHKKNNELMEQLVYEYAVKNVSISLEEEYNFILWIGITGSKRCWREQINGYAQIVNNLVLKYKKLMVFIDGITIDVLKSEYCKQGSSKDNAVVSKIESLISNEVKVINLVGLDYQTKVKYCSYVDAFIANAGTGCMVPLRFCKKPGVLHSNSRLFAFPDDYPETVITIDNKFIVDAPDQPNDMAMNVSYHIHWQQIYQALAKVIKLTKGDELPHIEAPDDMEFQKTV